MLTVKQLFRADGLSFAEDQIKLVRHVDHMDRSIQRIVAEGHFDLYQQEQSADIRPFHNCKAILSFLGIQGNKAEFYGAYEVLGHEDFTQADLDQMPDWLAEAHKDGQPRIKYRLRELKAFRSYRKRLIVQWKSTRGWHQKKDLDIYEILPATVATLFPGYQEVLLGFDALQAIFADPRAHRDWRAALEANAGFTGSSTFPTERSTLARPTEVEGFGRVGNITPRPATAGTNCSEIAIRRTFNGLSFARYRQPCRSAMSSTSKAMRSKNTEAAQSG